MRRLKRTWSAAEAVAVAELWILRACSKSAGNGTSSILQLPFDSIMKQPVALRERRKKWRVIENEQETTKKGTLPCGRVHATYTYALHSHLATSALLKPKYHF